MHSVALSDLPVLIEGESGAGKETLAWRLHQLSGAKGEFLPVYCGTGEADLGTGKSWRGVEGTLYLKHVSRLAPAVQQQLLGAIQSGLGAGRSRDGATLGLRLVSTTVEPLEPLLARGDFLSDLYFRLAVCRLYLPPLRERTADLQELFLALLARCSPNGSSVIPSPPRRLWDVLKDHPWPGNFRELENFAKSYAVSRDAEQIIAEMERRSKALPVGDGRPGLSLKEQVRKASKQLESEIILRALERHRWNRRRAAQTLKISYRALLYKMKECQLRTDAVGETDGGGLPLNVT